MKYTTWCGVVALFAFVSCSGQPSQQMPSVPTGGTEMYQLRTPARPNQSSAIQYIIFIVQENRTPDNLFQGLSGADIAGSGKNSHGQTIQLHSVPLEANYDMWHTHESFVSEYANGNMDGFNLDGTKGHCSNRSTCAYGYVPKSETQPYLDMASQYGFADRMFETSEGPSFPAHQYVISGASTTDSSGKYKAAENPYGPNGKSGGGCNAPGNVLVDTIDVHGNVGNPVYPCFNRQTLGDLLDGAGVSWSYYQDKYGPGLWHAYDAIEHIYDGQDYANIRIPSSRVLNDISHGQLAQVTWVTPTGANSDHAGTRRHGGPAWVASIVNALGSSKYWNHCAIFVVWDDWGGWYDHVEPVIYNSYELGFRVPLVVVSPYAKQGFVSHTQYEFGSLLKFAEQTFGTGSLGTTDARANSVSDMFNFSQRPRAFLRIRAPQPDLIDNSPADSD